LAERLVAIARAVRRSLYDRSEAQRQTDEFNKLAGTRLTPQDFLSIHSAESPEEFVQRAITPLPQVEDLTDEEAVEILEHHFDSDPEYWMKVLASGLHQPKISDLIFHPKKELQPEQLVRVARTCHGKALKKYIEG
jgi:hypothetical protein